MLCFAFAPRVAAHFQKKFCLRLKKGGGYSTYARLTSAR
jgi:hypothetical protein